MFVLLPLSSHVYMDDYQILMWIIAAALPAVVEIMVNRGE
jgi:hypothetical protein